MLFAAPSWIVDAGVIFGALVAFGTFAGLVSRSPIGRWFGRQVMHDLEGWVERISREAAAHALGEHKGELDIEVARRLSELLPEHLDPILYELRTNGGGSFRDQVLQNLRDLARRHDRMALFMDESTMDRHELRRLFEAEIRRSALAREGEVDDREEEDK